MLLAISCESDSYPSDSNTDGTDDPEIEYIHVKSINDIPDISAKFGTSTNPTEGHIIVDGKGVYVVDEWRDLWYKDDVTIKNVIFDKGISLFATGANEKTVTIENCTVKYCSQYELLPLVDANNNYRIDNSGNGLCLSFDGIDAACANIIVKNCSFFGDNDKTKKRKDSWPTTSDYLTNKENPSGYTNFKGRGNGIGLGTASGNGAFLKSVSVSNCTFEGLRNAAMQIYKFNANVSIDNCNFKSWGINSEEPTSGEYESYAIRGDIAPGMTCDKFSITNCTFNASKSAYKIKIDNLEVTL